jgi:hypothetical protein
MHKFEIDDVLSFSCVEILPFDFFLLWATDK